MIRTTAGAVRELLMDNYGPRRDGSLPDLTPFILSASVLVDQSVARGQAFQANALSDTESELIERWLAAHFYMQADRGLDSESQGGASGSFSGKTDMYLESTLYGQTAVRMDRSGHLQSVAGKERKAARAFWLGLRPSGQTPIDRRS
jgi:hypothetical protein